MELGDKFSVNDPVDQIRIASAPDGARFADEYGRLWKRSPGGLVLTLGSPLDKRKHHSLTLYSVPSGSPLR